MGNTAQNNGGGGIGLELSNNNLLLSNDVRFNSGGINLTGSSGNRIEANYASSAGGSGIEVGDLSLDNEILPPIPSSVTAAKASTSAMWPQPARAT